MKQEDIWSGAKEIMKRREARAAKGVKTVQFCPQTCPDLVLRGKDAPRCLKGHFNDSVPGQQGLHYSVVILGKRGGIYRGGHFMVKPEGCK